MPALPDFRPREPHIPPPVRLSRDEAILTRLFLRRYATWCARARHHDRVAGAAALFKRLERR